MSSFVLLYWISSVQFCRSVVSDFDTWTACSWTAPWTAAHQASLSITTPGAYSNSFISWWCHPTISSCHPLLLLTSIPASGSFPASQLFTSGSQSIGVSASASVLQMNIHNWFPLRWTSWIFLLSKGLSRVSYNTTVQTHQFFGIQFSL